MGELVDQIQLRVAAEDRGSVHLLELRVTVGDATSWNHLEAISLGQRFATSVRFEVADHDVPPGLCLGLSFLEHPVGLADARGHPKKDPVAASPGLLDRHAGDTQPRKTRSAH